MTERRNIKIGDKNEEYVVTHGRTYLIQAVAYDSEPGEFATRIDIDMEGRLDLERPGSDRLFFTTATGFFEVPASAIQTIELVINRAGFTGLSLDGGL